MSIGRLGVLAAIALAVFGAFLLASPFLRYIIEGIPNEISNEYYFVDAGHYERSIEYMGRAREPGTVIDARVDDFKVDGDRVLVARRPRVTELGADDALRSFLLPRCEYWVIDLNTHTVAQVEWLQEVRCL